MPKKNLPGRPKKEAPHSLAIYYFKIVIFDSWEVENLHGLPEGNYDTVNSQRNGENTVRGETDYEKIMNIIPYTL